MYVTCSHSWQLAVGARRERVWPRMGDGDVVGMRIGLAPQSLTSPHHAAMYVQVAHSNRGALELESWVCWEG
jgi:hypothetical protein